MKDYYYILGLDSDASLEAIKTAHRKLSKKFHPDLNPNDSHSERMFKDIQEAYECLSNTERRYQYDRKYAEWKHGEKGQSRSSAHAESMTAPSNDKEGAIKATKAVAIIGFIAAALVGYLATEEESDKILVSIVCGGAGAAALCVFLVPFLVATYRRHSIKWGVLGANIVLGPTVLGWAVCLAFAMYRGHHAS